jgi:hypothetical protein
MGGGRERGREIVRDNEVEVERQKENRDRDNL